MKQYTKEDFTPGTLVLTKGAVPYYGVVIDSKIWKRRAGDEDSRNIKNLEKHEIKYGLDFLVPIVLLGDVLGERIAKDYTNSGVTEKYVKRYAFSKIGENVIIIPRLDRLESIFFQMNLFFGDRANSYIESAKRDLGALKSYFKGGYKPDPSDVDDVETIYREEKIRFFERVLPKDTITGNGTLILTILGRKGSEAT